MRADTHPDIPFPISKGRILKLICSHGFSLYLSFHGLALPVDQPFSSQYALSAGLKPRFCAMLMTLKRPFVFSDGFTLLALSLIYDANWLVFFSICCRFFADTSLHLMA